MDMYFFVLYFLSITTDYPRHRSLQTEDFSYLFIPFLPSNAFPGHAICCSSETPRLEMCKTLHIACKSSSHSVSSEIQYATVTPQISCPDTWGHGEQRGSEDGAGPAEPHSCLGSTGGAGGCCPWHLHFCPFLTLFQEVLTGLGVVPTQRGNVYKTLENFGKEGVLLSRNS